MNPRRKDGYTPEQLEYLKEIADRTGRTNKEITEMFNKKFNQSRKVGAIIGIKSRLNIKSYTRVYTEKQLDYLKKITPGRTSKEITVMFNQEFNDDRTENSIKSIRQEHGIKIGNTGRFEIGNLPANTVEVGTEIIREDGYLYVKIGDPNTWKLKHHIVWEKQNGSIPTEHVILFGDGNRLNFNINNLILVTRHQLLTLNKNNLIKNDADLTRTAVMIADLHHKISDISKEV